MGSHVLPLGGILARDDSGSEPRSFLLLGLILAVYRDDPTEITEAVVINEEGAIAVHLNPAALRLVIADPRAQSNIVTAGPPIIDPRKAR